VVTAAGICVSIVWAVSLRTPLKSVLFNGVDDWFTRMPENRSEIFVSTRCASAGGMKYVIKHKINNIMLSNLSKLLTLNCDILDVFVGVKDKYNLLYLYLCHDRNLGPIKLG